MRFAVMSMMLLLYAGAANSADFCVNSGAALQQAMDAVLNSQNESHRVSIEIGTYAIDYVGFYSPGGLTIEGGYDAGCQHHRPGAQRTILQANPNQPQEASIHAFGGNLVVSDLAFDGYSSVYVFPQGSGFTLTVSRVILILAPDPLFGYAEMQSTDASAVTLDNVMIDSSASQCAFKLLSPAELSFSTIVNRGTGPGLCSQGNMTLKNSIVFAENATDIESQGETLVLSNIFNEVTGVLSPMSTGNLAEIPVFEPTDDPILRDSVADISGQSARDTALPLPFEFDVLGRVRSVGASPDRGAFELQSSCDFMMKSGFEISECILRLGHSRHRSPACHSPAC